MNNVSDDVAMVIDGNDQAASTTSKALEVRDIQLGNRKVIHITEDDVPNPPRSHLLTTLPASIVSGMAPRLHMPSTESP